jgi:hypothetical protein
MPTGDFYKKGGNKIDDRDVMCRLCFHEKNYILILDMKHLNV